MHFRVNRKISSNSFVGGGVKLADLPGLEVLEQPGDKVVPKSHTLNPTTKDSFPPIIGGNVPKFVPHKAVKLSASRQVDF